MNTDQTLSLLRGMLKIVGAGLATRGIGDDATVEAVIGAVLAVVGFWLSHRVHSTPPANNTPNKP